MKNENQLRFPLLRVWNESEFEITNRMNTKKNKPPKQVCASMLSAEVLEHERALAALEEAKGQERKYRRRLKTVRIDERTVAASINLKTIQLIKKSYGQLPARYARADNQQ